MASNNNMQKTLELAYMQVNNVPKGELKKQEHQDIIGKALTQVWSYEGKFPGENDILQERRLELDSPRDGQVSELAEHFKELYPQEFRGEASWRIIFVMYNRMKALEQDEDIEVSGNLTIDDNSTDGDSDIPNNNISNEEETKEMAKFETPASLQNEQSLEALTASINSKAVGGDIDTASSPVAVNAATIQSVRDSLKDDKDRRLHTTKTTVVEKVVKSGPKAVERAVSGEEAKGTISNPEAALQKFNEKFGTEVDPATGVVTFKNVIPGGHDDAMKMYTELVAAKADPEKQFQAYISKSEGSIKGVKIVNEKGEPVYKTIKELVTFIATEAMGILNTPDSAVQLQLQKARKTTSRKSTGAGLDKKKPEGLSGIATVRFTDRKKAMEVMAENHKELDRNDVQERSGFKTELCAKYIRRKSTEDGEDTTMTYRAPLLVSQYGLVVTSDELKEVFGDGSRGIGNVVTPIDITDEDSLTKMLAEITTVVAEAAANGVEGGIFDAIRANVDKAQAADKAAQAADFSEV